MSGFCLAGVCGFTNYHFAYRSSSLTSAFSIGNKNGYADLLTDFLSGIGLLTSTYRIRGDEKAEERLKEAYSTIRNTFHIVSSSYADSVSLWPIHPLVIDTIEYKVKDEIGFHLLLTGEEMPEAIPELINEPLSY